MGAQHIYERSLAPPFRYIVDENRNDTGEKEAIVKELKYDVAYIQRAMHNIWRTMVELEAKINAW